MAKLLPYCFILISFVANTQVLLPGYKDGKWWIIRSDKNIALPSSYTSLGLFDKKGYIIFEDEKSQGILDSNGRVIWKGENLEIESCGNGIFSFREYNHFYVTDLETGDTLCDSIQGMHQFNETYLKYYKRSDTILVHIPSRKHWKIRGSFTRNKYYQSVVCLSDSPSLYLFDPTGNQIQFDSLSQNSIHLLTYVFDNKQFLLTSSRHLEIPLKTANIQIQEPYISYFDGTSAHLVDLENDIEIARVPYESILPFSDNGYIVSKNGKSGWLDKEFRLKIPIQYDNIIPSEPLFYVSQNGLQGLIDEKFKMRIPCEFSQIYNDSSFYYTTNDLGMRGLYSSNFTPLLQTIYDRILIKKDVIKAYKGNKLRILKLDAHHRILSDIILENSITAKQKIVDDVFNYDKRLLPLGWYYERTAEMDSVGIVRKYKTRWGLKSADSILTEPKYINPSFVPDAPFSIVSYSGVEFNLINTKYQVQKSYRLVNYSTAKFMDNLTYLYFNAQDGNERNFFRAGTTQGHFIHFKSGDSRKVDYFSKTWNKLIPYAVEGKPELVEHSSVTIPTGAWLPLNGFEIGLMISKSQNQRFDKSVYIKDAKWNYLDSSGANRFKENFTFAQDFYKGTAIVKNESGWGVVDENRVIVPCEFSEIYRIKLFEDTLFIVQKSRKKYQFLDSNLTQIAKDYSSVSKFKNDLAVLSAKSGNALFFEGIEIHDRLKNARLLNNNYWIIREKKEFIVLDSEASEIFRTFHKPVRVLSSDFLLVENKGKKAVINSTGDTLLNFDIKDIEVFPFYFLVTATSGTLIYDLQFQLLAKQKSGTKILPNTVEQKYAIATKNSVTVYSALNKKISRLHHAFANEIKTYHHDFFIADAFLLQDTLTIPIEKNDNILKHKDGTLQLQKGKNKNIFYTNSIYKSDLDIRYNNVQYLGAGVVTYLDENDKRVLKNKVLQIELPKGTYPSGCFRDGLCLFVLGKNYHFLNENLEIVISKKFQEAKPFENGRACVKLNGGWTLMSTSGHLLSYPSFESITPVSVNFFQTKDLPTYGVYDSRGLQIIPPIYEQIKFVNTNIIQVVLKGQMGYLNFKGEPIFSIQ